ncbi:MAG: tetratricopeptide (TPR) repeat protein [Nonlabens sp.]|jgi:tetratricopeptide (TPR) repeat protein
MTIVFRFFLPFLIGCFAVSNLSAQTFKAFMKAGDKAVKQKNYSAALQYYQEAMTFKASDPKVWFSYAEAARLQHAYEEAESYYKRIINSDKQDLFPLTAYQLGAVQKSMGKYESAIKYFDQYVKQNGATSTYIAEAKKQIESCNYAQAIMDDADEVTIKHLNKRVNTPYSEFGPLMKGDTLYYSSFKFKNKNDEHDPPRRITKVMTSIRGSKGKPLPRKFNNNTSHTAHTTFSIDQKRIYYTLCQYLNASEIQCELYYREKDSRKRWSIKGVKLPGTINQKGTTATHPCIAKDTSGKELLYFVSDRAGGLGGLDIWCAEVNGKKFKDPINIKDLNTEGNDITPFWHEASKVLYFSSDYRKGMGGYDIFKSQKTEEGWSDIEHTGYPLNSSYNDLYYTMSADSTKAYFASNRLGSFYLDKNNKSCCNDIYQAALPLDETTIPEDKPIDSLTIVSIPPDTTDIPSTTSVGPPPVIEKVPTTLEDFLPLALYFHNDEPDRRTRRTYTKKSYDETYHPYYALKWEYQREYTKPMTESDRYQGEDDITFFFEKKIRKGYEHLNLFSEILLSRLEEGERVEIFVKGYTSPRAKSDYNISLGKRRISSVKNHFKTWRGGIFSRYLDSGMLILSERSFGETTASTTISDDLYDLRNSIYHPAAAEERRVEIVEIKRN